MSKTTQYVPEIRNLGCDWKPWNTLDLRIKGLENKFPTIKNTVIQNTDIIAKKLDISFQTSQKTIIQVCIEESILTHPQRTEILKSTQLQPILIAAIKQTSDEPQFSFALTALSLQLFDDNLIPDGTAVLALLNLLLSRLLAFEGKYSQDCCEVIEVLALRAVKHNIKQPVFSTNIMAMLTILSSAAGTETEPSKLGAEEFGCLLHASLLLLTLNPDSLANSPKYTQDLHNSIGRYFKLTFCTQHVEKTSDTAIQGRISNICELAADLLPAEQLASTQELTDRKAVLDELLRRANECELDRRSLLELNLVAILTASKSSVPVSEGQWESLLSVLVSDLEKFCSKLAKQKAQLQARLTLRLHIVSNLLLRAERPPGVLLDYLQHSGRLCNGILAALRLHIRDVDLTTCLVTALGNLLFLLDRCSCLSSADTQDQQSKVVFGGLQSDIPRQFGSQLMHLALADSSPTEVQTVCLLYIWMLLGQEARHGGLGGCKEEGLKLGFFKQVGVLLQDEHLDAELQQAAFGVLMCGYGQVLAAQRAQPSAAPAN